VAHGGIDTSAVGVTRRGRAVLLTLGDAVLVAPKGALPGGGGGGFCRPRGGGGVGSDETGVKQDAAGAWWGLAFSQNTEPLVGAQVTLVPLPRHLFFLSVKMRHP
jgi:hypothetical protein